MRRFIVSISTLVLISSVFAAPIQDSANTCSIDGTCVNEVAVPRELKARGCGVYYGSDLHDDEYAGYYSGRKKRSFLSGGRFDPFEACLDENRENITVTQIPLAPSTNVIESTAVAKTTDVAEVTAIPFQLNPTPTPTPASAPIPTRVSAPHGNNNAGLLSGLVDGLFGSAPLPASGARLIESTNNADNKDERAGNLIDLDLTATVNVGDLLQATATASLGLL